MNKPERIAHIIGKMWAGGVESVVFNYYRAIDHSKYQFDFFYDEDSTISPPLDLIEMGANFYLLPPYQRLPEYISKLREYLRKEKYRIIHSHLNTLSVFPLYAAWRENVPVRIAHNHSVPGGKDITRNTLKIFLKCFSRVFSNEYYACSQEAGKWLFGNRLYDKGRVSVVKNAIDFSKFSVSENIIKSKRKELGLNEKIFVIGHIGRFTIAKNHKKVIAVFAEVRKKRSDAILLLIGDGEEAENIDNWIQNYGVSDYVIRVGKVDDPQNYYPLIDVLILPSLFEGIPVTIIESQISGVPCVISDIVNREVSISNGCFFLDLNETDDRWAKELLSCSGNRVVLNWRSKSYDISYAVTDLEKKYEKLISQD